MYKKILVPLDGSEVAEVALPCAEELAVKLGIGIQLLRVVTLPVYSEPVGGVYTVEQEIALKSGAKEYLARLGCRLKEKGITVKPGITCSTAAEGVIDYALKDEIGRHKRSCPADILPFVHVAVGVYHLTGIDVNVIAETELV